MSTASPSARVDQNGALAHNRHVTTDAERPARVVRGGPVVGGRAVLGPSGRPPIAVATIELVAAAVGGDPA